MQAMHASTSGSACSSRVPARGSAPASTSTSSSRVCALAQRAWPDAARRSAWRGSRLNVAAAPAEVETVTPVFSTLPSPGTAGFNADYTTFAEEFRIRGSEAGPDQHANIISIANFLQVRAERWCVAQHTGRASSSAKARHHRSLGVRCPFVRAHHTAKRGLLTHYHQYLSY